MRIVLFLGAGFSKPFGLPVMNEFFSVARDSARLNDEELNLVRQLLLESRRANSFVESSPRNLEDVLSLAVMGDRLALDSQGNRADLLRRVLRKIYTTFDGKPEQYRHRYDDFGHFVGVNFAGVYEPTHSISIVTTNYDLSIESALWHLGTRADLGVPHRFVEQGSASSPGPLYSAQGIPLFKLHGSVNWYEDTEPDAILVEGRVVQVPSMGTDLVMPLPCANDYQDVSAPIIIPPSFLKPELARPLRSIWSGAAKALREADRLIFVGYSFPESDTEMTYFLAAALATNVGIEEICVVDPNALQIVQRLTGERSRFGSHFKALLTSQVGSWTGVEPIIAA